MTGVYQSTTIKAQITNIEILQYQQSGSKILHKQLVLFSIRVYMGCNVPDLGSICGLGRSTGEGYGSPLQYPCLGNSMDNGAWCATVHGVARNLT